MKLMKYIGKYRTVDYAFRKAISVSLYIDLFKKRKKGSYYVICRRKPAGFFSDYFYVIGHMILAEKFHMIPYVDMKNYPSLYSEGHEVNGTLNSWEYYFGQCHELSEKEVYEGTFCLSEEKYPYQWVPHYSTTNLFHEGFPTKRSVRKLNAFIKKNIRINDELLKEFHEKADALQISDCVGVHIRGTDMKNTKGHIKPRNVEEVTATLKYLAEKYRFDRIFLCTDEEDIRQKICAAFSVSEGKQKVRVCCVDAYRTTGNSEGLHWETSPGVVRENHKYQLGVEVLRDAWLLSRCKALVCGHSNVAYAAIVFNNNQYEWISCE